MSLSLATRTAGRHLKPADIVRGKAARLSWVWDSLCLGVPLAETSREGFRDVANNVLGILATGSADGTGVLGVGVPTWTTDTRGNPACRFDLDAAVYVEFADYPQHDRPSSALTAYIRYKRNVAADDDGGLFANKHTFNASPWTTWSLTGGPPGSNDKVYGSVSVGGTNFSLPVGTLTIPTTEYVSVFLRWRSGEAPRMDVYGETGKLLETLTGGSTATGTLTYAAGMPVRINASEGAQQGNGMDFSQALLWGRKLSDVEVASLVQDPFGWYAPRRESVLFAGPFPVFLPPTRVASVSGTSPYSGASIAPTFGAAGIVTAYTVTAGANQSADFTRTVAGSTTTDTVAAGDTQVFPTGAASAADVTYVELDSGDTGV